MSLINSVFFACSAPLRENNTLNLEFRRVFGHTIKPTVNVRSRSIFTEAVFAAGGVVKSPTGVAPDRYVYYPGTEELAKGEIRLTACGTGLPAAMKSS